MNNQHPRHCEQDKSHPASIRHLLEEAPVPGSLIAGRLYEQHRKKNKRPEYVIQADSQFYEILINTYRSITNEEAIRLYECNDLRSAIRHIKQALIKEGGCCFIAKVEVPGKSGLARFFLVESEG